MPSSLVVVATLSLAAVRPVAPPSSGDVPGAARSISTEAAATSAAGVLRYAPDGLDLGEMQVGTPKSTTLTITNASDAAVVIASIKGGCGCTTVSAPPTDPIAPGASFSVEITLDPGKKAGVELVKPVHVVLADGRVDTTRVKARVKAVVAMTPDVLEASEESQVSSVLSLESVDGAEFRILNASPTGVLRSPGRSIAATRFELAFDRAGWEAAGRPSAILLTTSLEGARELMVPIRGSETVALFRLPGVAFDAPDRKSREEAQDLLVARIDAGVPTSERSEGFRMRLHRESGMLFVHGSDADLEAARAAVRALPQPSEVRESRDPSEPPNKAPAAK